MSTKKEPPEDFLDIFGPEPKSQDFHEEENPSAAYTKARNLWLQDLKYFKGSGVPPDYRASQVEAAQRVYDAWGMGAAYHYEGRYGWRTRWPKSALPWFEFAAVTAIQTPHLAVAKFQVRLYDEIGVVLEPRHPFVPPRQKTQADEGVPETVQAG